MTPKLELYPHLDSVRNMDYMILYASCTCNFLTTSPPSIQLQHTPIKLFAPSVHVLEPQVLGAEWSWLVKAKAKYTYLRHHNLFKVKLHAPRGTKKADASHQESSMCSPSHIRIATIFAWTLTLFNKQMVPLWKELQEELSMDCKESSTIYCTPLQFQLQGTTDVLTSMSSLGFRIFGSKSPEFLVHLKDHFANRQPWVIFVVTFFSLHHASPAFSSTPSWRWHQMQVVNFLICWNQLKVVVFPNLISFVTIVDSVQLARDTFWVPNFSGSSSTNRPAAPRSRQQLCPKRRESSRSTGVSIGPYDSLVVGWNVAYYRMKAPTLLSRSHLPPKEVPRHLEQIHTSCCSVQELEKYIHYASKPKYSPALDQKIETLEPLQSSTQLHSSIHQGVMLLRFDPGTSECAKSLLWKTIPSIPSSMSC